MRAKVESEINRIVRTLKNDQLPGGDWDYTFETGITTDAYMIILLRVMKNHNEELIRSLVERILSKRESDGLWKLFPDEEEANFNVTLDAYYALLSSGYKSANDPDMRIVKRYLLSKGGLANAGMFSKILLAITGQIPWPNDYPFTLEFMVQPLSTPLNIFDISVFGRSNLIPILILADKKFSLKNSGGPDLSDLLVERSYVDYNYDGSEHPRYDKALALKKAEQYMLDRIEPDGTFLNYFSATFLMIFALMALGYTKNHPVITKAIKGLESMRVTIDGFTHMQYTTANIWNTTLINHAMQAAGVLPSSETVQKANHYLLQKQQLLYGDWVVHNPDTLPGGWGFSNSNTINPDVDDSTAALRAIKHFAKRNPDYRGAWDRGSIWVMSMQNSDGGWPAFERGIDNKLLSALPLQGAEYLLLDPSSADLTGRTLEFFGTFTKLNKTHPSVKAGINWLVNNQKDDGSWYGRWGICYIYGAWSALTGLRAVRSMEQETISKAIRWLKKIQNEDGGWGESCNSDIKRTYVPLGASTLTHTAWAVDALIACTDESSPEIERGIQFLLDNGEKDDWTTAYPKGQGMAGGFYIHYHSYRYIWPLLTLGHYRRKFG
ncbi:terpene cyclase/mutase family protein [Guptibacillus hwajinpoensis]|uniref:Squalene-hopene cyclase n=1 Tax=Guptibacillus hwajinpoensis TaxID=208199 RepID=A0A0J6FXU5_9BACL|nr:prenyltransferase/squalene oxidase repeat-containing protein [Alkalihalobacillus macyae]KMM39162.1 squalene-hopene cyclase [Alkalihalobacillus macyae]